MDLKQETIGLAVALELPLLVIDVQRAGPSTGMPTKTEAADLLMAIHGRHGESPLPVVAASTPAQCFDAVLEAARIAVTYRTPVILLSDTFLANSSEPWRLPDAADLPEIDPALRHRAEPRRGVLALPARRPPRAAVGAAGHRGPPARDRRAREGGRHRAHQLRAGQPRADDPPARREGRPASPATIRELEVDHVDGAEMLVLGWGSTYGAIKGAVRRVRLRGEEGRLAPTSTT